MADQLQSALKQDWRYLPNRRVIIGDGYADQPYLLKTDDGAWLCCVTVSGKTEGAADQHVQTLRSLDQGRTWAPPVRVEPNEGLENSYAVMLKTSTGRIFLFYNHNTDNVREILSHDRKQTFQRVDSLGHYVFRYSDDHGKSWSAKRYEIPVREFVCDRDNVYGGKIRFFWNVGKPFFRNGTAYVTLHKIGQMGNGFYQQSEGVLLASRNLDTEPDPEKIIWETLPDGDVGLRAPKGGGLIAEEQNCVVLSDGSVCCSYRGVDGYGVEAYSRDGGHSFEVPHWKLHYDGSPLKQPRACNTVWKYAPGKYIYWFHNHGGPFIPPLVKTPGPNHESPYSGRNPAWLCGGTEVQTPNGLELRWGNPKILLYDTNPDTRMSYPDFLEDDGHFFVTETEKTTAGVHEIPEDFLDSLFQDSHTLLVSLPATDNVFPPALSPSQAFSFQFTLKQDLPGIWALFSKPDGSRCELGMTPERQLFLRWLTPQKSIIFRSERLPAPLHDAQFTLDPLPSILSFYANGRFCDGGTELQYGWLRFPRELLSSLFSSSITLSPTLVTKLELFR